MKILKTLFILSTLLLFSCESDISYEQQVKNYNFYTKKSDSLIDKKEYKKALSYINAAIEITDTVPIAIHLKGFASYKLNLLDEAEENFSKVIEMEGKNSKVYKDRAKVYLKSGDNDFLDDINIHIANYPNDEEALILKREYFENKEDFKKAINEYSIAIEKNRKNINLLTRRADLYFKNGDYQLSIKDYDNILELNPKNNEIEKKKNNILNLINKNSNRNIFIAILICIYIIYVAISFLYFKPIVQKKASNQIGGEFRVTKDPLIWVLPITLVLVFITLYFNDLIPKF